MTEIRIPAELIADSQIDLSHIISESLARIMAGFGLDPQPYGEAHRLYHQYADHNDPSRMLRLLKQIGDAPFGPRELRLACVLAIRLAGDDAPELVHQDIDKAEEVADGRVLGNLERTKSSVLAKGESWQAAFAVLSMLRKAPHRRHLVAALLEVIPSPHPRWYAERRPAAISADAARMAEVAYTDRDWGMLPILADALEEAGACHPDLMAHLRTGGPHGRGCWSLDLVLGRRGL